ncbi:MAG TPA: hypothetical protein VGL81_00255 [Polyangiaceae bacterium]|jgi:hypothetical protein
MAQDPRKKRGTAPAEPSGPDSERPTVNPPEATSENERPTVNPPFDVEAFARQASGPSSQRRFSPEAPTQRPPPLGTLAEHGPGESREKQITLTDEAELEAARLASTMHSEPPPGRPSALSIADARSPSSGTVPAVGPTRSVTPTSIEAAVLGAIGTSAGPEITERTIDDPAAEMRERFSLGDYTGALEMSELILAQEADNLEAAECGENCRSVLEQMYAARLGPLERVPMVVVPRTQMRWLSMDHRAGFILSLIDGASSVDLILDVCGMPKLDALRILHELVQQKIVAFR